MFRQNIRLIFLVISLASNFPTLSAFASEKDEKWQELRSAHFQIFYQNAPYDFVQEVLKEAERDYEDIANNLGYTRYVGWSFDRRAKIYIYDDQTHYVNKQNISWSHGVAYTQEKIIRTFPTAYGFFDSTLPHELGHIIFREFIGYSARVPAWMDEGVAMYQEKAKRFGVNKIVKKAMEDNQFIPLKELSHAVLNETTDKKIIDLFYAESASIVYYMITELGEFRFVNFCRQMQEGNGFDEALHRAYANFRDLNDLNQAWVNYLSSQ